MTARVGKLLELLGRLLVHQEMATFGNFWFQQRPYDEVISQSGRLLSGMNVIALWT